MRLDDCLTADETSIVRELGKRCLIIRERMATSLQSGRIPGDQGEEETEDGEDEDEGNEEVQEFIVAQDEGTIATSATELPDQTPDSLTAPEIEAVVVPEETPQHEVTPEPIPPLKAENFAETKETKGLGLASRLKATLQSIQNRRLQELQQPGQKHQPSRNAPILRTVDSLSQPDTFGVLDMVISIVGDFYGQKDLLADRKTPIHLSAS